MDTAVVTASTLVADVAPKKARKPRAKKVVVPKVEPVASPLTMSEPVAVTPLRRSKRVPFNDNPNRLCIRLLPDQLKRHYHRIGADHLNHEDTVLYAENGVDMIDINFYSGFVDTWAWVETPKGNPFPFYWELVKEHQRQEEYEKAA